MHHVEPSSRKSSVEAFETLWILTKEAEPNSDELLLAKVEEGGTALDMTAERYQVAILE
jgi:hypothetical protein